MLLNFAGINIKMETTERNDVLGESKIKLVPAHIGKRFTNYIVDRILLFTLLFAVLVIINSFYPLLDKLKLRIENFSLLDQLVVGFIYGLYMSAMEALLKGKTPAKYLTRTRAVSFDGKPVTTHTAFVRGLLRMIPFQEFTALSIPSFPLHDRFANALVVDEDQSILDKS